MAERVIFESKTGRMVGYKETPQQRAERIRKAARRAEEELRLTRGQRRTLAAADREATPA